MRVAEKLNNGGFGDDKVAGHRAFMRRESIQKFLAQPADRHMLAKE